MTHTVTKAALYQRVLGESWWKMDDLLWWAHEPGPVKHGRFHVVHGEGRLARRLADWSRLPQPAESSETWLQISAEGAGERWERSFDGVGLSTRQWSDGHGLLMERFRQWELAFELRVEDGSLIYEQRQARFCLGRWRLKVPRVLAPFVRARESADGLNGVRISVSVTMPVAGLLIAYDGFLKREATLP